MSALRNARKTKVIFSLAGIISFILLAAFIRHLKSIPVLKRTSDTLQKRSQSEEQTESKVSMLIEPLPLGSLLGYNKPAIPPIVMHVGHQPGPADTPDLSTPAAAVYSVLSFIDQAATEKIDSCFLEYTENAAGKLYPRYLGHPVELVEAAEEDDYAEIIWNATVHTIFSLDGRNWSPGEKMKLKTTLVRVEELWKIVKLHDGDKDGSQ